MTDASKPGARGSRPPSPPEAQPLLPAADVSSWPRIALTTSARPHATRSPRLSRDEDGDARGPGSLSPSDGARSLSQRRSPAPPALPVGRHVSGRPPSVPPPSREGAASVSRPPRDPAGPSSWPSRRAAPREEPYRPEDVDASRRGSAAPRGGSMPVARTEPPSEIPPRVSVIPRIERDHAPRLVELALPEEAVGTAAALQAQAPHLGGRVPPPRTALEARVRCTLLARELGVLYLDAGLELRLDRAMIAPMQEHLLARFPTGTVRTRDEAREAELHGAALAELLARHLGGAWVDVTPTEPGYWAMVVTAADRSARRIWPFGRVLRLIAGVDDDLLGFYDRLRAGRDPRG